MAENTPEEVAKELGEVKEAAAKEVDALERRVDDVRDEHAERDRLVAEQTEEYDENVASQAIVVRTADQMLRGHLEETVTLFAELDRVVAKAEKVLKG